MRSVCLINAYILQGHDKSTTHQDLGKSDCINPSENIRMSLRNGRRQGWNKILRSITKRGGYSFQYGVVAGRGKRFNPIISLHRGMSHHNSE